MFSGSSFSVSTPASHTHTSVQIEPVSQEVVLRVMACKDAHIALMTTSRVADQPLDPYYEIVLGGYNNQKSDIRKPGNGGLMAQVETPDILNEFEYRTFWISWKDGVVKFGQGSIVGELELLRYEDPAPLDVSLVSLSTWERCPGMWKLKQVKGK